MFQTRTFSMLPNSRYCGAEMLGQLCIIPQILRSNKLEPDLTFHIYHGMFLVVSLDIQNLLCTLYGSS